jgi:quinolinate synthase
MADGSGFAFSFTPEVEAATAPLWARLSDKVSPLEWRLHAPLIAEINRLKRQKNAVILAHNYMTPEIFHGVGDYVGDSLGLAREAAKSDAAVIIQAGVHFMAETSKILAPEKKVYIPDLRAGCSLASSITGADVRLIKQRYPGLPVVTYVNTTADVKAETDVCCTSANAVQVVEQVAAEWGVDRVILIPDEFLARNVARQTSVRIIAWQGRCEVHERFDAQDIRDLKLAYPDAEILGHPECPTEVIEECHFAGSTAAMVDYVQQKKPKRVVLITECSMADNVAVDAPVHPVRPPLQPLPAHEADQPAEHLRDPALRPLRGDRGPGHRRARPPGGPAHDRPAAAENARSVRHRKGASPRRRGADLTIMAERLSFDGVLVVGGGLAGLSAALACAPRRALVLAPPLGEACATAWAQGGVAAAVGCDDSPELHAADTVAAGAGLVSPERALLLARSGPEVIERLAALGAPFDRTPEGWARGLEAAHSRARVVRVRGDGAGRAVMDAVAQAARAAPHVEIREAEVVALLQDSAGRVRGVLARQGAVLVEITAAAVVLATGGLGGLYAVTTNPPALRGEGLAMAALAGAEIADPEFVQFHPTALDVGRDPAPLATEALRGEGAVLVDAAGRRFMPSEHPLADLAPRDIVARAVAARVQSGEGAFLDAREAVGERFPELFPAVFACLPPGRHRPAPSAHACGTGRALPHGRDRHDRGRPHHPAWPLRRGRVRRLRRARRQPARLQLPARSRRLRRPRGSRRRWRGRPARRDLARRSAAGLAGHGLGGPAPGHVPTRRRAARRRGPAEPDRRHR